jgi:hypothetical protein
MGSQRTKALLFRLAIVAIALGLSLFVAASPVITRSEPIAKSPEDVLVAYPRVVQSQRRAAVFLGHMCERYDAAQRFRSVRMLLRRV